jgi:hypothetical protein
MWFTKAVSALVRILLCVQFYKNQPFFCPIFVVIMISGCSFELKGQSGNPLFSYIQFLVSREPIVAIPQIFRWYPLQKCTTILYIPFHLSVIYRTKKPKNRAWGWFRFCVSKIFIFWKVLKKFKKSVYTIKKKLIWFKKKFDAKNPTWGWFR